MREMLMMLKVKSLKKQPNTRGKNNFILYYNALLYSTMKIFVFKTT